MNKLIPSYPNKYFKSKHERFKNDDICVCECDCDMILSMIDLKKGDTCYACEENDHTYPVYRSAVTPKHNVFLLKLENKELKQEIKFLYLSLKKASISESSCKKHKWQKLTCPVCDSDYR